MICFEWFIRAAIFNFVVSLLPTLPRVKNVQKQTKNISKILKTSFQKSNQKNKSIRHQLRNPSASDEFPALMEKKPKSCAVLKIEAFVNVTVHNKNLKMTHFDWFFRSALFNLSILLLPSLPPRKICTKTATKYFQNSKNIVFKIKLAK